MPGELTRNDLGDLQLHRQGIGSLAIESRHPQVSLFRHPNEVREHGEASDKRVARLHGGPGPSRGRALEGAAGEHEIDDLKRRLRALESQIRKRG